jgi:hypothetical protein
MKSIAAAMTIMVTVLSGFPAAPAAAADPVPALSPMPTECATPPADRQAGPTFANLARAMATRQRIVALAIGSSVVADGRRKGDYYGLVERFLEKTFKGLDVIIVQRGVSGELARDAAARIRLEVARSEPDVVFWQVGTADALAGIDPAEVGEVVRTTARWLRGHGVDVVLIGLHYSPALRDDPQYQVMRAMIDDVARSEGILRIRRYEAGETLAKLRASKASGDFAGEPAGLDNSCMAEALARALATGLFARRPPAGLDTP